MRECYPSRPCHSSTSFRFEDARTEAAADATYGFHRILINPLEISRVQLGCTKDREDAWLTRLAGFVILQIVLEAYLIITKNMHAPVKNLEGLLINKPCVMIGHGWMYERKDQSNLPSANNASK